MAELAGFVVGGVALASLYSTCIECLDDVQAARSFGADFESTQLRLDLVHLRFSRWGKSTQINGDASQRRHGVPLASNAEAETVRRLLDQISVLLEDGKKIAQRYQLSESAEQQTSLELVQSNTILTIHNSVREIARRRQKGTSLRKKFSWVISDKHQFDELASKVGDFVNQLVELFPAIDAQQQRICVEEVEEISRLVETQEINLLRDTAYGVDASFASTVEEYIKRAASGHSYEALRVHGESKMFAGNLYVDGASLVQPSERGHSYKNIESRDKARALLGDQYGGKGLFDD